MLVLAGCRLDVEVTAALAPDGSGLVTVRVQPDAELLAQRPDLFGELVLDDAKAGGWQVDGPTDEHVLTLVKPFRTPAEGTRILQELNGPQGPLRDLTLTQARTFAETTSGFSGAVQLDGGLAAFSDSDLLQALGSTPLEDIVTVPVEEGLRLTVRVVLPGVMTSDGTAPQSPTAGTFRPGQRPVGFEASSTSWTPSLSEGVRTTMVASAVLVDDDAKNARRTSRLAWWATAAYATALIAVAAFGVVRMRRRPR